MRSSKPHHSSSANAPAFWAIVMVFIALLGFGIGYDGYEKGRAIGKAICLGCLGLDPEPQEFSTYWVDYPDGHKEEGQEVPHPDWVLNALEENRMVFLFFWFQGCVPCKAQWDDMVDHGLVKGEEGSGSMARYTQDVHLISIDITEPAHNPGNIDGNDVLYIYDADGKQPGAPVSAFIITLEGGEVAWWSHDGQMRSMHDIEGVIEEGLKLAA